MKTEIRQITTGNIVFSLIAVFAFLLCFPSHIHAQRAITAGSSQVFYNSATSAVSSARLSDGKILVTYRAGTASTGTRYVVAGTVDSGDRTITWGTPQSVGTDFLNGVDIVAFSSTKAVVFLEYNSSPDLMQYCVLDIDGTDITLGSVTTFTSDEIAWNDSYHAAVLSSNQVVVCYEKASTYDLELIAGTVDGTTITWGSAVTFDNDINFTGICRITDSKFAVVWEDDAASPDAGRVRIGTVSGNTITAGASTYDFETSSMVGSVDVTALSEERIAITWEDDGTTDVPKIRLASVSGTVVTLLGSTTTLSGSVSNDLYISPLSSSEAIVTMNGGSGNNSLYFLCTLSGDTFGSSSGTILSDEADDARAACLTSDLFVISYVDDAPVGPTTDRGESKVYTVASGSNPEINVQGNGVDIESGDNTPSTADYTDFGTGATLSRTFTIQNLGSGTLTLGSNAVTITGTDAANFSVNTQPATTVSGSSSTTFVIDFASTSATSHSAEIHINSDDIHEPDYFFSIQATGASPTITFINGANASLNFTQTNASPPEDNWLLGQFSLAGDDTGATLNSVIVTLDGTYDSGDLQSTPFQLYAANSNSFGSASTLGSSVADPGSGSDVTFSSLSDALPSGTRYYWVTADVSATATGDDTINGTIAAADDLSITDGTLSGSSSYGKLNAGDDATLPVELSAFTAQVIESVPTLYWETQSETDNMGWFIYRNNENDFSSSDQVSDFIEGHGTTTQIQSYLYGDTIEDPVVGDVYYYWLESIDYSGLIHHYDRVAILTIPESYDPGNNMVPEPEQFGLLQNEPNPVVSSTQITFNLTETAKVDLAVYNLKGQRVKTLYSGDTSKHTVVWDGRDDDEKELENGVYLYQLIINGKTEKTKKLILMK